MPLQPQDSPLGAFLKALREGKIDCILIGAMAAIQQGAPLMTLEPVEGETLAERLRRGPSPVTEAFTVARQIAEALREAREKGIIHRDLKPGNVKITSNGRVKVLDFELAKMAAAGSAGIPAGGFPGRCTRRHGFKPPTIKPGDARRCWFRSIWRPPDNHGSVMIFGIWSLENQSRNFRDGPSRDIPPQRSLR